MTKPQTEAGRMASEYQKALQRTRWEHAFKLKAIDPEVIDEPWKIAFLAGFKAAVAQAELKSYAGILKIVDLKKLLEPKS